MVYHVGIKLPTNSVSPKYRLRINASAIGLMHHHDRNGVNHHSIFKVIYSRVGTRLQSDQRCIKYGIPVLF